MKAIGDIFPTAEAGVSHAQPSAVRDSSGLTPEQEELAAFGKQLFERLGKSLPGLASHSTTATVLASGEVVVAQSVRGGGRIIIAPDKTVLFVGSATGTQAALAAFRDGKRTPLESFGQP